MGALRTPCNPSDGVCDPAAWLSTAIVGGPAVHARERLGVSATWARISDGKVVLPGLEALDKEGAIAPVLSDEWGITHEETTKNALPVWTGTNPNGSAASTNCNNWSLNDAIGAIGAAHLFERGQWTYANQAWTCTNTAALYCFQVPDRRIDAPRKD